MARIRALKPDFFTSPSTAAVDFPVRIFYQALWCNADDFGVGETNFNALLGLAFPDSDGFTAQDVRRFCADCAQHFGTTFYTVSGRHYYAIPTWEKHQKLEKRTERRKYPSPDDPGATPDQRIHGAPESAPILRGCSSAESRESVLEVGTGEQGNRGTEPPYPPGDDEPPTPQRLPARTNNGAELARRQFSNLPARSATAYHIAEAFSAALPVPIEAGLLSGIGVQIDKCLKRGIPPPAIAAGLKAWTDSDSWSPTQIPNFVHKANNRSKPTNGKPTEKALGYDDALAELLTEVQTL